MASIDDIMGLLDWNKSIDDQNKGMSLAKEIKSINVFLQPCNEEYNKNVWENCAKVLTQRTDDELTPYLVDLMEWLQDMNWPGAVCVYDRLRRFTHIASFQYAYTLCLKCAQALKDSGWESNLRRMMTEWDKGMQEIIQGKD